MRISVFRGRSEGGRRVAATLETVRNPAAPGATLSLGSEAGVTVSIEHAGYADSGGDAIPPEMSLDHAHNPFTVLSVFRDGHAGRTMLAAEIGDAIRPTRDGMVSHEGPLA